MKVRIELNEGQIVNLLKHYDYITEDVTGFYSTDIHHLPYNSSDYENNKKFLSPMKVKIAYKNGERPSELDKEYPILINLMDFYYDRVINSLFSQRITELMNL